MRLTVAVCTWNRARLLAQTLEGLTRLRIPPGIDWEVLVVNNNCTDNTDEVIASYNGRLPLVRCWEPTPGASHARNCVVRHATGDYILWTDDDALPDEDWLAAYCRAFADWPAAAVFGGPIRPCFEGEPPGWLRRTFPRVSIAFAAQDLGDEPTPLSLAGHLPFGPNMVIRSTEQRRHLYDPALGPRPGPRVNGEETAVLEAILRSGGSGRWVPEARVRHYVPRDRQTVGFLRHYYRAYGRTIALRGGERTAATLFGKPRWAWRRAVEREVRFRVNRLIASPANWVEDLIASSTAWGVLSGTGKGGTR